MTCKPGDLAIVVRAQYPSNIGKIVQVLAPHDGRGELSFRKEPPVWLVRAPRPLTWYRNGRRYRRKTGPVPDNRLQPIRGLKPGEGVGQRIAVPAGKPVEMV